MPAVIEQEQLAATFMALVAQLYHQRYNGAVILNFRDGIPLVAEYCRVQITLERVSGLDKV
jgi:hypothetical protein